MNDDYEGFGEITFYNSRKHPETGVGRFANMNLKDLESTKMKTSDYRRCTQQEIQVMHGRDPGRIGPLIQEKLKNVNREV